MPCLERVLRLGIHGLLSARLVAGLPFSRLLMFETRSSINFRGVEVVILLHIRPGFRDSGHRDNILPEVVL